MVVTPEELNARNESRVAARQANPDLTPFDTGEMLEPHLWGAQGWGKVDFDDEDGVTALTLCAYPSLIEDGLIVLDVSSLSAAVKVSVLDGDVVRFAEDVEPEVLYDGHDARLENVVYNDVLEYLATHTPTQTRQYIRGMIRENEERYDAGL